MLCPKCKNSRRITTMEVKACKDCGKEIHGDERVLCGQCAHGLPGIGRCTWCGGPLPAICPMAPPRP